MNNQPHIRCHHEPPPPRARHRIWPAATRRGLAASLMILSLDARIFAGTEYHVAVDGCDDNHDGLAAASAFATVQKGVDSLAPGDTLTIWPGEYLESVRRSDLGDMQADTVIRAAIPGTVLLRGDVPAPEFEPAEGYRYVHRAPFSGPVQAVNEIDTMFILQTRPSVAGVEFTPGTFHYDEHSGMLYISTSDMRPPAEHRYTVSTIESRGGIFLQRPSRVVIDGLAVRGFHSSRAFPRLSGGDSQSDVIPWGIYIWVGQDCVVRNVTALLNAGGIGIISRERGGNLVEKCVAYANYSQYAVGTANIFGNRVNHDLFRHNYAYHGQDHGIRFHGGGDDSTGHMHDNMGWGHSGADVQIKGVANYDLRNMISLGAIVGRSQNSLMRRGDDHPGNIVLPGGIDDEIEFADPLNLDYRLQATSRFRGAGPDGTDMGPFPYQPNIYFVAPSGNNGNDGLSIANAWADPAYAMRRIGHGDTLYIEPGIYEDDLMLATDPGSSAPQAPLRIRGRGRGRVVIRGGVTVQNAMHTEFERIQFEGPVTVIDSQAVRFHQTAFSGIPAKLRAERTAELRITHSEFDMPAGHALELRASTGVFLQGNVFGHSDVPAVHTDTLSAILYGDYNRYGNAGAIYQAGADVYDLAGLRQIKREMHSDAADPGVVCGPLGLPRGIYCERKLYGGGHRLTIDGPVLHSVSATTANLEWWSSHPSVFRVRWGVTPEMENEQMLTPDNAYHPSDPLENFNTFSLNGLAPETRHHFAVEFVRFADNAPAEMQPDAADLQLTFTTAATDAAPRTLYVAVDGDDRDSGLSRAQAWRTINHAADQVRPGDTVLIDAGEYREKVRLRVTGEQNARITFKALPGAKVIMDGDNYTLQGAFWLFNNKDHIDIDGLYLQNYLRGGPGSARYGAIAVLRSRDIRLTRLFHAQSRPEIISIASSDNVLVRNCVTIGGWDGIAVGNATNVRLENNVIVRPNIRCVTSSAGNASNLLVRNNIITDNIRAKMGANIVPGRMTLENNCFFMRAPESERSVFGGRGEGLTIAEYERRHDFARGNLAANPWFAGLADDTDQQTAEHFQDGIIRCLNDFPDLFAANPALTERGIGLQPEAFADFHFTVNP